MLKEVTGIRIEKNPHYLSVYSYIDFGDDNYIFCGMPYVSLIAIKDTFVSWNENDIGIAIHDRDDFDIGLVYEPDSEHFFIVLHELINWMKDHEQGISSYNDLLNLFDFFPDCGCKRKVW